MPGRPTADGARDPSSTGSDGESVRPAGAPVGDPPPQPLTRREKAVLRMLVDGARNREIAQALGITERTVKFHVTGLFEKLGVKSRTQVVVHALQQGLVEP